MGSMAYSAHWVGTQITPWPDRAMGLTQCMGRAAGWDLTQLLVHTDMLSNEIWVLVVLSHVPVRLCLILGGRVWQIPRDPVPACGSGSVIKVRLLSNLLKPSLSISAVQRRRVLQPRPRGSGVFAMVSCPWIVASRSP